MSNYPDWGQAEVVVPSTGRADKMSTLDWLPQKLLPHTVVACRPMEVSTYRDSITTMGFAEVRVRPTPPGIHRARQFITHKAKTRYVLQVSDDLRFAIREGPGSVSLREATRQEVGAGLGQLLTWMQRDGFAHVGMSTRGGNNRVEEPYKDVTRMNDVYGHDTNVLHEHDVRWDRLQVMEDFDVTLQLLRLGYPNRVLYLMCWDQPATNHDGGCSTYRTPEVQKEGAFGLKELHPEFVRTRRASASNWEGFPEERWDVTCYWKKAYESSKEGEQ